ncbi:Crp/Fnr family transcriptional regulator [Chryseobacterium chendengshani]|uniref:Crp/Fnr family transcriptional regulator n=1 Tax=Chryseobacterium sp. LJ756 TaxID=2864113 RepID=UPI001C63D87B|nr:Crp/Fnr family transcriptional regulator [Chryseobacterium sp. LJ756]MBW7674142.1 Crp/Fnr family transcriptional regulator [Chryseobacterium sp. LJ756]
MIIKEQLLTAYGAELITYKKDDSLFSIHDIPDNYYQVESGLIKVTSEKFGSNQFIHDFANAGDPVGESFLFSENRYTVNAVAVIQSNIFVLPNKGFRKLTNDHNKTLHKFLKYICERETYKLMLINTIAFNEPRDKILTVIDHFKKMNERYNYKLYEVPFTRQQLASLTGLRVETVIRTMKIMESEKIVEIIDGKVFI